MTKEENSAEEEKVKNLAEIVQLGQSNVADNSAVTISVAVGLLGILALFSISNSADMFTFKWWALTGGYWLIFLFGVQAFAFHIAHAITVDRFARGYPEYRRTLYNIAVRLPIASPVWKFYLGVRKAEEIKKKLDDEEKPSSDEPLPIERHIAAATVLFYFLVALILYLAVAVPVDDLLNPAALEAQLTLLQ